MKDLTVYYFSTHPYSNEELKNSYFTEIISDAENVNAAYARKEKNNEKNQIKNCPAFRHHFKNTFSFKSLYDYSFSINRENETTHSNDYDQDFFDHIFITRDIRSGLVSIKLNYLHIIPEEPVEVSQIHPTLGKGELAKHSNIVPGTFNPYHHPRPIESAFWLSKDKYNIKQNDDLFYLKFHTNKKINLKRIHLDKDIIRLMTNFSYKRNYTKSIFSLSKWYELGKRMNTSKRILSIIKEKKLEAKE